MTHANRHDRQVAGRYELREADWRNGAVVYQVLVGRFAPSADLDAKRHLYPAPKTLRAWTEEPRRGRYLDSHRLWSHEIDFWGGDLASLRSKLDHVQQLGADVLYLNPICQAYTNHKYDALDHKAVSPEYGTRHDVVQLADELHLHRALESIFVVANPTPYEVKDLLLITDSKLMDGTTLLDLLGQVPPVMAHSSLAHVTVPPHTVLVLKPEQKRDDGYTNDKRVQ